MNLKQLSQLLYKLILSYGKENGIKIFEKIIKSII